jgi:hypothetical protein
VANRIRPSAGECAPRPPRAAAPTADRTRRRAVDQLVPACEAQYRDNAEVASVNADVAPDLAEVNGLCPAGGS